MQTAPGWQSQAQLEQQVLMHTGLRTVQQAPQEMEGLWKLRGGSIL